LADFICRSAGINVEEGVVVGERRRHGLVVCCRYAARTRSERGGAC
jgi:hypothetical protein